MQCSSNPNDYQKYSATPQASAPPVIFSQPAAATGIPVGSANQFWGVSPQPAALHVQHTTHAPWSSGLCGCCSDVPNCCITFWCPCITFGQISEIVDRGSSSCVTNGAIYALIAYLVGCACFYSCFYRSKLRNQYMLKESPCGDCLVHFCCETCALCQEYRELKSRGFDMSIGWQGNVDRQNPAVAMGPMAPVVEDGMYR